MCLAVALVGSEVPTEIAAGLGHRLYQRGAMPEYRWYFRDRKPRLPILRDGQFSTARWGNGRGQSRLLPRRGWTTAIELKGGLFAGLTPIAVEIRASYALDGRGGWYPVFRGIRGVMVPDEHGWAVVYMLTTTSSHYYRNMTGSDRMPVFIGQTY